jgi:hypothetical protein
MKNKSLFTIIIPFFCFAAILSSCSNSPLTPTVSLTPKPSTTPTSQTEDGLPPYPTTADNFILTEGLSGSEARSRIEELGAGGDLSDLEKWYETEGIIGSGQSNFAVPVVFEAGGKVSWNLLVKKNNGHFFKFTITDGSEAGQTVRAMGMSNYCGTKPSFEVSELIDPEGGEGVLEQRVIWDESGWNVIGAFQGDTLIAWFNADAPDGGAWVKVNEIVIVEPTSTPAPEAVDILFDKSRFEVVEASDGNTYQGYIIEDEYGTRLVDETNSIILVGDEEGWKVAESKKYSEEYPAVFSETKIGKADGFEIPITIGLSANVKEGIDFTYSEVHMTQLGADDVASLYLHSAWKRYANIMHHSDVTYEEYLILLKEGKGNIEILDSTSKEPVLIDPRQGFSLVITGDKTVEMPIRHADDFGSNYDSDNKGKLLWAGNFSYHYHHYSKSFDSLVKKNSWFLFDSVGVISWISVLPDKCMMNKSIEKTCGVITSPGLTTDLLSQFTKDAEDFFTGKSRDPLFSLN